MDMKMEKITINGVDYVKLTDVLTPAVICDGMRYGIVRCHDAGVHAGYIKSIKDRNVEIINSRRLWRWNSSDNTLSGLSQQGPYSIEECKFGDMVPEILVADMCEIDYCSDKARKAIMNKENWKFGGDK
jgi:hypothetical protein